MRFKATSPEALRRERRERWIRERAAAQTVRTRYPAIDQIRVDFSYEEEDYQAPSPQACVLHPPARAFFEFSCPYADCDGTFNLGEIIHGMVVGDIERSEGVLICAGARLGDRTAGRNCGLRANYVLAIHPA